MTRQRKYQIQHKEAGLCVLCSKTLFTRWHCKEHAWKSVVRSRKRVQGKSVSSVKSSKSKKSLMSKSEYMSRESSLYRERAVFRKH